MVHHYKRTTTRGNYGDEVLQQALKAIQNGSSLKAAARNFGVPPKTLRRHRDQKVKNPGFVKLGNHTTVFTKDFETELVNHIKQMERALFGLTTNDIRSLAYELATRSSITNPFNHEKKKAGKDWLQGFMLRHPDLSIRNPQGTSIGRAVGFNRPQVSNFFRVYKDILQSDQFTPLRIWNMDETGITNVQKPTKIIATKGTRQIGKITSGEKGKTVSILCAMNAAGTYIPPLFIFPRLRMVPALMNGAPTGAIGLASPNGWSDGNIFVHWLHHFVGIVKCTKNEPHILILDGHFSHKTLDAVIFARDNGIIMLTLPPHCTHKMQPLDRTLFKSLKSGYNSAADNWMVTNPGRRISFYDMALLFSTAYNKSANLEKAVNGFRCCGLWPFNDNIFSEEEFAAAEVTNEIAPVEMAVNIVAEINERPIVQSADGIAAELTNELATLQSSEDLAVEVPNILTPVQITDTREIGNFTAVNDLVQSIMANITIQSNTTAFTPLPTTIHVPLTPVISPTISPNSILQELSPLPKINIPRTRKRKAEVSTVLTASPFKKILEEKSKSTKTSKSSTNKNSKRQGKEKQKQSQQRKRTTKDMSDSSDEEWPCLVCGEPYANSKPKECWVQCIICKHWAHEECTLGLDQYVCQNCDSDTD